MEFQILLFFNFKKSLCQHFDKKNILTMRVQALSLFFYYYENYTENKLKSNFIYPEKKSNSKFFKFAALCTLRS